MANGDGGDASTATTSQSKRPPSANRHDSADSQLSDPHHQQQQQQQQQQQHPRSKHQKHVVGGGGTGRLHARVSSSKALHKLHATSSNKLTDLHHRRRSPSPDRAAQQLASHHRRAASDARNSSTTNLKKNASQSSLKRNRSHVDVTKRNKSATQLKRSFSNPGVGKLKSTAKSQVHFDLGTDGGHDDDDDDINDNDGQDDEWVDASTSASPFLSRRPSTASGGQSTAADKQPADATNASPRPLTPADPAATDSPLQESPSRGTAQHNEYLTSRLLQRNPPKGAPPQMSGDTASALRRASPDSGMSRESASTLSGTPQRISHVQPGSSGKDAMTSRFVTTSSHGSGTNAEGSFYAAAPAAQASRQDGDDFDAKPRRPRSMGALGQASNGSRALGRESGAHNEDNSSLTDDDGGALAGQATSNGRRARRSVGGYAVPPAEFSRTQQKLNLERASSSLEPSHRHHQGPASGSLLGGAGYDTRDPRVGKLLERTGMEYLVVRRYQNPVARSLARVAQVSSVDKSRRIPNGGASGATAANRARHAKRASDYGGAARFGLSSSFRERDSRDIHSSSGVSASKRPRTPKRSFSSVQPNGAGSSADTEEGGGRLHEGLSGSSFVDGEDDDGTVALLRNLWEKNLDLSTSQD